MINIQAFTNMNKTLYILAAPSLLQTYRVTQNITDKHARLELVDELKPDCARPVVFDCLHDQTLCFGRGSGTLSIIRNLATDESHRSASEQDSRLISRLAERITALLNDQDVTSCCMAICGAICQQLFDAIDPKARAKIVHVLASNLKKADPNELVGHFEKQVG